MIQISKDVVLGLVFLAAVFAAFSSGATGQVLCVEGDCDEDSFDSSNPHVVVGDIAWENRVGAADYDASLPDQYGPACGDDPNEYLIRQDNTGEFNADTDKYACVVDEETRCTFDGEVYVEGDMEDVGEIRPSAEERGHSPDREICLNKDETVSGGTWHDIDDWTTTEEIRSAVSEAGSRADALVSEEWRKEWRDHPDSNALSSTPDPEPDWLSYVETDSVPVPAEVKDSRGGFGIEDDCHPAECQDILGGISGRYWGNFSVFKERGAKPDDYEDGTSDFNLDIVHNRMAFSSSGVTGHGASNEQDQETDDSITNRFHKSEVHQDFNEWAFTESLSYGIGPFGGAYDDGNCYGRSRQEETDISKKERVFANSFVNPDGYWVDPDDTERTVSEGGLSCDLTGDDRGIGYDSGGGVVTH